MCRGLMRMFDSFDRTEIKAFVILLILTVLFLSLPVSVFAQSAPSQSAVSDSEKSGSSSSTSPASTSPSTSQSSASQDLNCVPQPLSYGTISRTLYDLVISIGSGETDVIGISRQPLAVGIDKEVVKLSEDIICKPVPASKNMDMSVFKQLYGATQMDVESQLKDVSFLSSGGAIGSSGANIVAGFQKISGQTHTIKLHRKIVPIIQCVEREIMQCKDAASYEIDQVTGYEWAPDPENPDQLAASSFGITIDINPSRNPSGTELSHDMPQCFIDAFKKFGFSWGGDYKEIKIPSHFEFLADPNLIVTMTPEQMTLSGQAASGVADTSASGSVDSKYSVPADSGKFKCSYCHDMQSEFDRMYPDGKKETHWTGCFIGNCPKNSYINPKVKYFKQTDKGNYPMPSGCVDDPKYDYANVGCAAFSFRMALSGFDIQKSAKEVFCGKLSNTAVFPGFQSSISGAAKNAGVSHKLIPLQWDAVVSEVKKGHPVIFDIDDHPDSPTNRIKARFRGSRQHYLVAVGAGDDFLIVNDPAGNAGEVDEHLVISRSWFEQSAKKNRKGFHAILPPGGSSQSVA